MRFFTRVGTVSAFAAAALTLGGCGADKTAATARGASRTIDVTMSDNPYQPTQLQVTKGETVTLRFKNTGMVTHEAILGDDAMQMKHHDEMTASTGQMEHGLVFGIAFIALWAYQQQHAEFIINSRI